MAMTRARQWLLLFALSLILATGAELRATPTTVRADTVVVVVSASSEVSEVSRLHLADLYLGRTARFENGDPAEPIDLAPGTATRGSFYGQYLGRTPAEIKAHWSKIIFTGRGRPPPDVPTDAAMVRLVAGNPHAIGYVEHHLVDSSVRVVRVE